MGLYEEAARRGLKSNVLVLEELPSLGELHKIHYARYPRIETKLVPFISQFDDVVEQLFADVRQALGVFSPLTVQLRTAVWTDDAHTDRRPRSERMPPTRHSCL